MSSASVLLAETDLHTLDHLPRILSTHFPQVVVDICTSAENLRRKNDLTSYDTIAMSSILLQNYRLLKHNADHRLLTSLLVTASFKERLLASAYLPKGAFDLIIKPIIPHEATKTLRLALWQSKLLQLLASKERAWARFHEHMNAFPLP